MTPEEMEIIERLAELEHQQWSHWTKYILERLGYHPASSNSDVRKWFQQAMTEYKNLTKKEKESDRMWARKVFTILKAIDHD